MSRMTLLAAAAALALLHAPASAQQGPTVVTDLLGDLAQAQSKMVSLAEAMPESTYGWRPGQGVRSVAEVFKHVAGDNYFTAGVVGPTPPATTGIVPPDYATAQAYEARQPSKAEIIAELKASFAFFEAAVQNTGAEQLAATITVFGSSVTRQQLWIMGVTHIHEHLGQAIAYARVNGVVPPWSR